MQQFSLCFSRVKKDCLKFIKSQETKADKFKKSDEFKLGIAPEGTRSKVTKWKTGFYYIACGAKIPIILLMIDYQQKEIGKLFQFYPSGNFEKDMSKIQELYQQCSQDHHYQLYLEHQLLILNVTYF